MPLEVSRAGLEGFRGSGSRKKPGTRDSQPSGRWCRVVGPIARGGSGSASDIRSQKLSTQKQIFRYIRGPLRGLGCSQLSAYSGIVSYPSQLEYRYSLQRLLNGLCCSYSLFSSHHDSRAQSSQRKVGKQAFDKLSLVSRAKNNHLFRICSA